MNGYYYIIKTIKDYLKATGLINTVTTGDIFNVDLAKQTIFPLVHIITNNVQLSDTLITLNISVLFMDIVDESKSETIDIFEGNDNELDVLNTQLTLANRFVIDMLRGSFVDIGLEADGVINAEPFMDRFVNKVAGWTLTFDVQIGNEMTIC